MSQEKFLKMLPTKIVIEGFMSKNEVMVDGKFLNWKESLKVRNHSPTGLNWGYGGSGPSQFSLALLLKYVPPEMAQKYYMDLKFNWVAGLPRTDFVKTINLRAIMTEIINKIP